MIEATVFLVVVAMLPPMSTSITMVQEVSIGETAVLHCPSNDDNHRFQFWQLQHENMVIGPTNKFNKDKYKYEVLTGTLYIRGVSSREHGVYTCVCKHIDDDSFYSENVELIVNRDWEEVYETDHTEGKGEIKYHDLTNLSDISKDNVTVHDDSGEPNNSTGCRKTIQLLKNKNIALKKKIKEMEKRLEEYEKYTSNATLEA